MTPLKCALLASGNGSNAENILRLAAERPDLLEVRALISDNPEAGVLRRAEALGTQGLVVSFDKRPGEAPSARKARQEERLLGILRERNVEWLCLAGYQRILSPGFIRSFYDPNLKASRIINIHPSLLPSFPGKDAYMQAFRHGVRVSGATLHLVDAGVDTGPILLQAAFERHEDDTLEMFMARGLLVEHRLYRRGLELLAQDRLRPLGAQGE